MDGKEGRSAFRILVAYPEEKGNWVDQSVDGRIKLETALHLAVGRDQGPILVNLRVS